MRRIEEDAIINDLFSYHPPTQEQTERFKAIRDKAWSLALSIVTYCPDSPERDTAITKLRETVMWANSAIALNGNTIDNE
jgi:hypothetical protein